MMATEFELALFEEELQSAQNLPEAIRWQLERDKSVPLGLFASMHPISKPTEIYKARIRWTDYFNPFYLKFINFETGADDDPTAWPIFFGSRPAALVACISVTAEGHALHPDWKDSVDNAFPKVELPMQYALLQVQFLLDSSYEGRGSR